MFFRRYFKRLSVVYFPLVTAACTLMSAAADIPKVAFTFLDNHCLGCHDSIEKKGDFDMESLGFDLDNPDVFSTWVNMHDRADHGEMPPKKKERPDPQDLERFLKSIGGPMVKADQQRYKTTGRSTLRLEGYCQAKTSESTCLLKSMLS